MSLVEAKSVYIPFQLKLALLTIIDSIYENHVQRLKKGFLFNRWPVQTEKAISEEQTDQDLRFSKHQHFKMYKALYYIIITKSINLTLLTFSSVVQLAFLSFQKSSLS